MLGWYDTMPDLGQSEVGDPKLGMKVCPRPPSSGVEKLLSDAEDGQGELSLCARSPGTLLSGIVKLGRPVDRSYRGNSTADVRGWSYPPSAKSAAGICELGKLVLLMIVAIGGPEDKT